MEEAARHGQLRCLILIATQVQASIQIPLSPLHRTSVVTQTVGTLLGHGATPLTRLSDGSCVIYPYAVVSVCLLTGHYFTFKLKVGCQGRGLGTRTRSISVYGTKYSAGHRPLRSEFNTVDHGILLQCLQQMYDISGKLPLSVRPHTVCSYL